MTSDHLSGHAIARRQIEKHGRDRYPRAPQQYRKLVEEIGELGEALITHGHTPATIEVRKEYADVGLALFELGNKMGIDLIAEMRDLVDADHRNFAPSAATQAYGATGCT